MQKEQKDPAVPVPVQKVGPVLLAGPEVDGEIEVPLATFEKPLWPSVNRGARVTAAAGGIRAVVVDERMTRSVLLEAPDAPAAVEIARDLPRHREAFEEAVSEQSRFARLIDWHVQHAANLLFIRFAFRTGDAAGHNMVTAAADKLLAVVLEAYPALAYVSISGNICTDKKPSAVNGILGRGRHVIAETTIPEKFVRRYLKTSPERIVDLNIKKNLVGTMLAGGIRSANAHFANMLIGVYLATGQDAANIVEGSQGSVHAESRDGDLYFSVTLPNLILGTVGAGKGSDEIQANLRELGCLEEREPGANARRLAVITAATVLCGELSLLAAQTNPGELMRAHLKIERTG